VSIQPFTIAIPQATLDDLHERLARTRWPDEAEGAGWEYGVNREYMKVLAEYWQNTYDWRKYEANLNRYAQFRADVGGVGVHFIHERGKGPDPTPLLLLHGWPDSFYRYHKVIPMLTDPARFGGDPDTSFDVIVPSIPGAGFSDRMTMNLDAYADLFMTLMRDVLGYQRFVSAGGDVGGLITLALAHNHPETLTGIHLTDVGYPDFMKTYDPPLSPAEQQFAGYIGHWWMKEGGYNVVQSNKPQTLAYGMNDSPTGLAAWIMDFTAIGSTGEDVERRLGRDVLLTNITLYWVTQTIGSSFRWYYEMANATPKPNADERPTVPAAVAHCPWDAPLPREWAERKVNLTHFTDFPRGGHFIAWEEPELYASDIQDFARKLRK
jgi:pimeloyl-ACP methyl ester carboxylesterase